MKIETSKSGFPHEGNDAYAKVMRRVIEYAKLSGIMLLLSLFATGRGKRNDINFAALLFFTLVELLSLLEALLRRLLCLYR